MAKTQAAKSRFVWWVLKALVSICILGYLVWYGWSTDQFQLLSREQLAWPWLLVATMFSTLAHFAGFYRWYWIGHAAGLTIRPGESVRYGLLGNLFSLIGFGVLGGDGLRAWYAMRVSPGRRAEAFASVLLDRAIGMFVMFLCAAIGYLWCREFFEGLDDSAAEVRAIRWMCLACGVIGLSGLIGTAVMTRVVLFRKQKWYRKLEGLSYLGPIVKKSTGVAMLYRNRPDAIVGGVFLSVLVNVCFAVTIWSVARFLPGDHPRLDQHLVIAPIAMVANCFPLPGGIGGMEVAVPFLYRTFRMTLDSGTLASTAGSDVPESPEVLVAIVFRMTLLFVAGLGVIAWLTTSKTVRDEIQQADEK